MMLFFKMIVADGSDSIVAGASNFWVSGEIYPRAPTPPLSILSEMQMTDGSQQRAETMRQFMAATSVSSRSFGTGPAAQLYEHRNVSRLFNITFRFFYVYNVFFGDNMSEQKGSRTENNEWKDIGNIMENIGKRMETKRSASKSNVFTFPMIVIRLRFAT